MLNQKRVINITKQLIPFLQDLEEMNMCLYISSCELPAIKGSSSKSQESDIYKHVSIVVYVYYWKTTKP